MCWSAEASFALAAVGITTVAIAAKNGEKKELFLPLLWFSLMELLQGFTYWWIDLCDNPHNQVLTLLGYLHIAFQPLAAPGTVLPRPSPAGLAGDRDGGSESVGHRR